MPKRGDIQSILIVGAGPIIIGQGCEFDYSGTQACKALKEEGYKIILINSNPATIMTDPTTADRIYIEPITLEVIEKIIEKERPDAILPTVGGQTALNCCLELHNQKILKKYNVEMIGAKPDAIDKAENRKRFNQAMLNIGLDVAKNAIVNNLDDAISQLKNIGLPAIIRPSFTLGGTGGGIAASKEEYEKIVINGLRLSPSNEVLIDESLLGWKEYEMEVVRDNNDNVIIICSIENIDPMGVHTGDSITVAPAQTLTDKEYQQMRDAAIAVIREIGVETGGSNVQFAVNPLDGRMIVIEMNPRVSRSSALASKATGFPIAKIASKLAVGYNLDELKNDITRSTPASFEPSIDYIVTKIPRFTFEKFGETNPTLSTAMRSVGESMAIERSFTASLQKCLRSMETGLTGLDTPHIEGIDNIEGIYNKKSLIDNQLIIKNALIKLAPERILIIAEALRWQISVAEICRITSFDKWFVEQLNTIVIAEKSLIKNGLPQDLYSLLQLKKLGFSDAKLGELTGLDELNVYKQRHKLGVRPVFKMIDTCAGEFEAYTSYMYSCYEGDSINPPECESCPIDKKKVVILGSGPNRIGQGIEFDYSCTHAATALSDVGYETIMINCNPETVSTDYDTSNRLYFEPLTKEDVSEVLHTESSNGELVGVIVTLGGQTPLKLSHHLAKLGFPISGTPTDNIDLSEDRERFKNLLHDLNILQPNNSICTDLHNLKSTIEKIGYPIVIRPSNVLGGRAMSIINNAQNLVVYLKLNKKFIADGAILIEKFLNKAIEIDVDALADGDKVYLAGIMEHIEAAGIHSGDSACYIPTRNVSPSMLDEIQNTTIKLARALNIIGLMNIQYAIKDETLYVLEVNPRSSRTLPFVSKATGVAIGNIAARIMLGEKLRQFNLPADLPQHFSVKEVVFPFARFSNLDIKLKPEMQSTGEVMGMDHNFEAAYYKSQLACGYDIKKIKNVYIDFTQQDKDKIIQIIDKLIKDKFNLYVSNNAQQYIHTLPHSYRNIIHTLEEQDVLSYIKDNKIQWLIDIDAPSEIAKNIRIEAYSYKIYHCTTIETVDVTLQTMDYLRKNTTMQLLALQDYQPNNIIFKE